MKKVKVVDLNRGLSYKNKDYFKGEIFECDPMFLRHNSEILEEVNDVKTPKSEKVLKVKKDNDEV